MICEICGCELKEEWEVFGDIGETFCFDCFHEREIERLGYEEVYGLGPHHHDLNRTGSIIGSTVFDPITVECNQDGWYHLAPGVDFMPDPEVPGLGTWRYYWGLMPKSSQDNPNQGLLL